MFLCFVVKFCPVHHWGVLTLLIPSHSVFKSVAGWQLWKSLNEAQTHRPHSCGFCRTTRNYLRRAKPQREVCYLPVLPCARLHLRTCNMICGCGNRAILHTCTLNANLPIHLQHFNVGNVDNVGRLAPSWPWFHSVGVLDPWPRLAHVTCCVSNVETLLEQECQDDMRWYMITYMCVYVYHICTCTYASYNTCSYMYHVYALCI